MALNRSSADAYCRRQPGTRHMYVFSKFSPPLLAALARSPPLSASTTMQRKVSQCPLATISLGDQPSMSTSQEAQGSTAPVAGAAIRGWPPRGDGLSSNTGCGYGLTSHSSALVSSM